STTLAPIVGHEPDLISVRGVGGVRGYVRNEELNPDINSPAEYQAYLAALEAKNWRLPVYDLEGNVIGEFELSRSEDVVPGAESPETIKAALAAGK
ncbi:MAG: hypothetical protein K2L38_02180, partial [Dysosmobacter sp.]|nr:hypothetical protein [Dysosmobacter sp.]